MKRRYKNRGRVLWVSCQVDGDIIVGFGEKRVVQGTFIRGKSRYIY